MDAPSAAREYLQYWNFRDLASVAADPMSAVRRLDPATQQVLYVGAEQLLDTVVCEYERSTGDVAVYLDPRSGEEYRVADGGALRQRRCATSAELGTCSWSVWVARGV